MNTLYFQIVILTYPSKYTFLNFSRYYVNKSTYLNLPNMYHKCFDQNIAVSETLFGSVKYTNCVQKMENFSLAWNAELRMVLMLIYLLSWFSVFSTLFMQNQMARALLQMKPYLPKGFYTTLRESLPIQPTMKRWEAIIQCWTSKLWQKTWNEKKRRKNTFNP